MYNYIDFTQFKPDEVLLYLRKSRSDDPLLSVEEVLALKDELLGLYRETRKPNVFALSTL